MNRKKMQKFWFSILAGVLALLLLTACTDPTEPGEGDETVPTGNHVTQGSGIRVLEYAKDAVQTLEERKISLSDFSGRGAGESNYKGNSHYDGTNLVVSPYFTGTVGKQELPVYATPVYVATDSHGALHSFASVDVDFEKQPMLTVTLKVADSVKMHYAQVFSHDAASLSYSNQSIRLSVTKHGAYTIVINDDQDYAITVFVRTLEDEEAQIKAYQDAYGEENVIVYEPGLHEIDYILMLKDNTVLYLKSGAILLPKHTLDIMDDKAASNASEFGANETNALGLKRYSVINGFNADNMIIAGRGTVDMTQMDWHERRGIVFSLCNKVSIDGVIVINPSEWAFITYRCKDVTVTQSAVLGYRTNSDAFAICNTIGASVTDCFARTGDDMFEVKTLGGVDGAVSRDITFTRCQAWGSKARCFGVIGEIEKDVSNILFEDGIVIFRDAIWDNNRIGSLVVLRECGKGVVDGITFRDISIHYDAGRPIQVGVYSQDLEGSQMKNILFENVAISGREKGQIRLNSGDGNTLSVVFKNVLANGAMMNEYNVNSYLTWDRDGLFTFEK